MHRRQKSWLYIVAPICLGTFLLAGWYVTTALRVYPNYLIPTPGAVAKAIWDGLIIYADMWGFIGTTLTAALLGSLLGFCVALPLAVLIYRSRLVSAAVIPFLGATQAIPAIALAPLLVTWVGFNTLGRVLLCAVMVFFPILVSSVVGFRHIDQEILSAAQVDGAGSLSLLFEIEIPSALPNILAGVRNGFTLSITGAVVGEMVMGGGGLGSLLYAQWASFNVAGMFATIFILIVLATTLYTLVSIVERRWSNLTLPKEERQS